MGRVETAVREACLGRVKMVKNSIIFWVGQNGNKGKSVFGWVEKMREIYSAVREDEYA